MPKVKLYRAPVAITRAKDHPRCRAGCSWHLGSLELAQACITTTCTLRLHTWDKNLPALQLRYACANLADVHLGSSPSSSTDASAPETRSGAEVFDAFFADPSAPAPERGAGAKAFGASFADPSAPTLETGAAGASFAGASAPAPEGPPSRPHSGASFAGASSPAPGGSTT